MSVHQRRFHLWDPRAVLDLQPSLDGECVGFAPSKGRKCRNRIAARNRCLAGSVLEDLARTRPDDWRRVGGLLEELAECMLCVRLHRVQVDAVAGRWMTSVMKEVEKRRMAEAAAEEREEEVEEELRGEDEQHEEDDVEDVITAYIIYRATTSDLTPSSPILPPTTETQSSVSENPTSHSPTTPDVLSRSTTPTPTLRRTSSPTAIQTEGEEEEREEDPPTRPDPSRSTSPSPSSIPLPPSLTPSPLPSPDLLPLALATRKPVSADATCPICWDALLAPADNAHPRGGAEALVWCRARCGQNFHRACWEGWERESRRRRVEPGEEAEAEDGDAASARADLPGTHAVEEEGEARAGPEDAQPRAAIVADVGVAEPPQPRAGEGDVRVDGDVKCPFCRARWVYWDLFDEGRAEVDGGHSRALGALL